MMAFPLLTFSVVSGNTDLPLTTIGVSGAFAMPHMVRSSDFLCFSQQTASGVSSGWFRYWRKRRPDVRETQAAYRRPGSVVSAFFVFKSQNYEVPMFRYLLSSRFLRFRLRLMSQLSNLAGHTAATVTLGALLVLPALYFGEVL